MNYELLPNEEIKQIKEYPNYYITSFGRVWSILQGGHWLKPTLNKHGYHERYYVSLGRGNKKYVHQLVAQAFLPNPNNYTEVDHIDGNSTNNNINNLHWVTHQDNMTNPNTIAKIKRNGGALVEIEEIATGKTFWGYKEASQYSGLHIVTIQNHTGNKVKHSKWRLTGRKKSYNDGHIIE